MRNIKQFIKEKLTEVLLIFRKPKYSEKVFCIGYNKTGTTSLGKSLELLGYRHSSFNKKVWRKYYGKKQIGKIIEYTSKFDSFDDLPWLKEDMIPILYNKFPDSKFIYLTRDEQSWKNSLKNWHLKKYNCVPDLNAEWESYKKHKTFVLNFFKDKPSQFISLSIADPYGFKKLADFLGKETNSNQFPHLNKSL